MSADKIFAAAIGGIFIALHLLAPKVSSLRPRLEPYLGSLAGGFAIGFIFLEILPQVETYHEVFGERIYFFILLGFTVYYGAEYQLNRGGATAEQSYSINIVMVAAYNFLLALTIGDEIPSDAFKGMVFTGLFSLHVLSSDLSLMEENPVRFVRRGRYVLAAVISVGVGIHFFVELPETVADIAAASMVGAVLYRVFRDELPEFEKVHFTSFGIGGLVFAIAHLLLD